MSLAFCLGHAFGYEIRLRLVAGVLRRLNAHADAPTLLYIYEYPGDFDTVSGPRWRKVPRDAREPFPKENYVPRLRHDFKLSFRVCRSPAISLTSPLIIRPSCIIYQRSKETGHVCALDHSRGPFVIIADNCGAIRRFAGDSAKYYADALYCYPIYRAALSPRPAKASAINKHQRASERASERKQ